MTPEALQRQDSAAVARHLLALFHEDALDNPEQWTWDHIAGIPSWCLLSEQERSDLQCICGAVACAPAMLRWIDAQLIRAAYACCGEIVIETLINDATQLVAQTDMAIDNLPASLTVMPEPNGVKDFYMNIGAGVLTSSLDSPLSVERLGDSLGESKDEFEIDIAKAMIRRAQQLYSINGKTEEQQ